MNDCSAPKEGHEPGSQAERDCAIHGTNPRTLTKVGRAVSKPPTLAAGSPEPADPLSRPEVSGDQRRAMRDQIGLGNVLSISGGRITPIRSGIELPVAHGYRVRVHLEPDDTYTVERIYKRGLKETVKGSREGVYAEELGETAYRAGMYASYDENEWPN